MEVPKIYPRSSEIDFKCVRSFDWEGDLLSITDGLVRAFGDASDREIIGHYQVDCTELREFLEAKRAGKELRPVVRGHWYWDKDGMDWGLGAWRCSACKAMSPMWWNCDSGSPMHKSGHKFCPNCGAMMEES